MILTRYSGLHIPRPNSSWCRLRVKIVAALNAHMLPNVSSLVPKLSPEIQRPLTVNPLQPVELIKKKTSHSSLKFCEV